MFAEVIPPQTCLHSGAPTFANLHLPSSTCLAAAIRLPGKHSATLRFVCRIAEAENNQNLPSPWKRRIMNSIRPAIEELERMYKAFAPLFGREMPLPVITIQSKGRKNALGWHWKDKWQNAEPGKLTEINLCAEYLGRPAEEIAETMLHEMVHHANNLDGVSDCTIRQYHNQHFKNRCDEIGLICEKYPGRGWAKTSLSDDLKTKVQAVNINADAFTLFRTTPKTEKMATKMKKWRCSCTTVRAAVQVEATCKKCGLEFILQNG